MFELKDKTAIVTGGGSGIGRAIAEGLAKQSAKVVIAERNEADGAETAKLIADAGGTAEVATCDVTDPERVQAVVDGVKERHGRIDILINNAGIGHVGNLLTTETEDLDRLYAVNIKGVFNCAKSVVPHMKEQGGGVVVNLASIASLVGVADRFAYSMTKGAVLTMTYSMAVDFMAEGIRTNCICPARVHTPFVDSFLAKNYPGKEKEMFEKLSAYQPIGRMGKPEEVAAVAVFLCSDEAAFITGQALGVDGGVLVH